MQEQLKNELQAEAERLGYNMTIERVEVEGVKRVIILQDPLDVMSDAAKWLGERFDNVTINTFNACRVTVLEKLQEVNVGDDFVSRYPGFPLHGHKVTEVTKRRVSYISTDPGANSFEYSKSRREFEEHLRGGVFTLTVKPILK